MRSAIERCFRKGDDQEENRNGLNDVHYHDLISVPINCLA